MNRRRLRVTCLESRDVPSTFQEIEPNNLAFSPNDVSVATGSILTTNADDWLSIQGVIDTISDRDYFRLTLSAPAGVFFDFNSQDTGLSSSLDGVLDVFDSSGVVIMGSNDQGYDFDRFTAPTASVANATSPDPSLYLDLGPGTYLIRVMPFQAASVGAYQLRVLADANSSASPPVFASRPTAPATLYLDFDGHSASDDWGTYVAGAFNLPGGTTAFSPGETLTIRNFWRIVAEDFLPFNINVTTVEPPSFADTVAYRLVLTSSPGSIVGQASMARGAAIFNSFGSVGTNTGFVFQPGFGDYLGGISGRMVAASLEQGNQASQSFGTALGLRFYGGVNNQLSGIMQVPDTGLNRATWSSGMTHSGEAPIVVQNDVAVITSPQNGLSLTVDDHGDAIATAANIAGSTATGLISTLTERDMFAFPAQQGNSIVNVTVNGFHGNVDLELGIYNAAGQLLTSVAPGNSFNAGVTVYIPNSSFYFAEVRGSGVAGAIGSYQLELAFAPVTGPGQVISTIVNNGAVQRSMVRDLAVRFSRPMSFPNGVAAAFVVSGVGGPVPIDVDLSESTPSQTIARLRFPNGVGGFGSIGDGNYQLTVVATNVLDDDDEQLDGDFNGSAGGNYTFSFYRLFGDVDGDRTVAASDFIAFRQVFNGVSPMFDYNDDGAVSAADFVQFRLRFGSSI